MPNQPKTPTRVFRIDDVLYSAAKVQAEAEGRTLSDVVREALTTYVGGSAGVNTPDRFMA